MLATIAAHVAWIVALRRSGLEPRDAPVWRGVMVYGPALVINTVSLIVALRYKLFTPAELGLRRPAWAMRHGRAWFALVLFAVFIAAALVDFITPLATMTASGMAYEEIVEHVRQHEYRYTYGRLAPPPAAWNIAVEFIKAVVVAPLDEELPYRALFVPVALSKLSRSHTALASGAIFFLVHWLAYGAQAHPVYFLSGWLFAWAFMWAGLPAALAAHGGENFGSSMLGTLSAFVR